MHLTESNEKWITDKWGMDHGSGLSVRVTKLLEKRVSKFQTIEMYETSNVGNMLVLDGIINVTEFDEAGYHEMMVHVPMCCHPDPKRVLVIGGGDGGAIKEALKHPSVEKVDICEIDSEVIDICQKYMPEISSEYANEKVTVYNEDGAKFIQQRPGTYDIIIVDSSDPIGPAEVLFQEQFYRDIFASLTADGIATSQSEGFFFDLNIIKRLQSFNRQIFPVAAYYYTMVPTYPSGIIGFSFCSKKYHYSVDKIIRPLANLRYYSAQIHEAAFQLPHFAQQALA